jgi:Winged helix-turn-helix DNA-binding
MPGSAKTLSRMRARDDARHLLRYLKSKANISVQDIAKSEHVSVKTVQQSIRDMEAFESLNSEGQVLLAVRDLVRTTIPQVKETIYGLLTATNTVERKNEKTGLKEYVQEPDKITRQEAVKVFTSIVGSIQPKGPGVNVQVNQQNHNQTAVLSSAETTEERMRRLKAKAAEHNLLPPVVVGTPEAIDKGFDPDDDEGDDGDED